MERSATMKTNPKTPKGKPLRQPREKRNGPSLEALSQELGVSPSTVFRWETKGVPGRGNAKMWREQALQDAMKKLIDQRRAAA